MSGKTILYVHGFGSAGSTHTAELLRQLMPRATVIAPDLPIHPDEAITLLNDTVATAKPQLIVGTSMGGMYAEQLHGVDRILVNPAFEMGDTMSHHGMVGKQTFQNPRQDGVQEFIVTKALVKEYKELTDHCFEAINNKEQARVWGLFGDEDTTVNTYDLFHAHYPTAIRFHGEHRMNDNSFMHAVVPVIRWIDDCQEGRERPIIYIDINTLADKFQKPNSSAQKTIRTLLETYQLFFVAPAPAEPEHYAEVNTWLYDYITVPAYGHTVFTNQKQLLYGDYLIDAEETETMGTLIQFGTDTFKTWDDIADYFSRLGGQ